MKLYVGNLSFKASQEEIQELFENHGTVDEAAIIMDRETGRSRGFAFVTMPNSEEAQAAIDELDGFEFQGRPLRVNEARERSNDRPRSGGGGGYGRKGGGGYNNRY